MDVAFSTSAGMTTGFRLPRPHRKARLERPESYPERFPVPDERVEWYEPFPGYAPNFFESEIVLQNDCRANPCGWADPHDLTGDEVADRIRKGVLVSFEGPIRVDQESGMPLNPFGRTGIEGRGLLGRWGPNLAVDPIVTRWNPGTARFEMITILRDTGEWAIPGGMVDHGEAMGAALRRELFEETGVTLPLRPGISIYDGYADDPRTTDNAWFETSVELYHLTPSEAEEIELRAGSDALAAKWMPMAPSLLRTLYASHGFFALHALKVLLIGRKFEDPEVWELR